MGSPSTVSEKTLLKKRIDNYKYVMDGIARELENSINEGGDAVVVNLTFGFFCAEDLLLY